MTPSSRAHLCLCVPLLYVLLPACFGFDGPPAGFDDPPTPPSSDARAPEEPDESRPPAEMRRTCRDDLVDVARFPETTRSSLVRVGDEVLYLGLYEDAFDLARFDANGDLIDEVLVAAPNGVSLHDVARTPDGEWFVLFSNGPAHRVVFLGDDGLWGPTPVLEDVDAYHTTLSVAGIFFTTTETVDSVLWLASLDVVGRAFGEPSEVARLGVDAGGDREPAQTATMQLSSVTLTGEPTVTAVFTHTVAFATDPLTTNGVCEVLYVDPMGRPLSAVTPYPFDENGGCPAGFHAYEDELVRVGVHSASTPEGTVRAPFFQRHALDGRPAGEPTSLLHPDGREPQGNVQLATVSDDELVISYLAGHERNYVCHTIHFDPNRGSLIDEGVVDFSGGRLNGCLVASLPDGERFLYAFGRTTNDQSHDIRIRRGYCSVDYR